VEEVGYTMLERYGHGGDLKTAEEAFGLPASEFVDFSSNMNPYGPPPSVRRALLAYAEQIDQYPDPAVRGLRRKLAERHGIEERNIVVGNGAAELIDLIVRVLAPKQTVLAVPCFAEYGDAVRKIGGEVVELQLEEQNGFALDLSNNKLAELAAAGALFMLGSPNNPTGQLVDPEFIGMLLQQGATVVVDEAFMDFVPEEAEYSLIQEAVRHEKLFVLRSMTKFYAIPGIRLGYLVGMPQTLGSVRRLQVPWSVNSLAQSIGEAVLEEAAYAEQTLAWLQVERPWLASQLEQLGFTVYPGATNYVLARIPETSRLSASMLQLELGKLGVLIRDASRFPGLDHTFIRLAVKLRVQNERLLQALAQVLDGEAGGRRYEA
jgi:threonine-phosphate decarboxylase